MSLSRRCLFIHLTYWPQSTTTDTITTTEGSACSNDQSTGMASGALFTLKHLWSRWYIYMMQNCKCTKKIQRKVSLPCKQPITTSTSTLQFYSQRQLWFWFLVYLSKLRKANMSLYVCPYTSDTVLYALLCVQLFSLKIYFRDPSIISTYRLFCFRCLQNILCWNIQIKMHKE